MKLHLKKKKKVDYGDFVNGTIALDTFDSGFVFGTLSPTTSSSRVASREPAFNFHTKDIELPESIVFEINIKMIIII